MAEVIWTEPALSDLDTIADYIALDNPEAAKLLVQKVFRHVEQLADHPKNRFKAAGTEGLALQADCRATLPSLLSSRGLSRLHPVRHAR